MKVVFIQPIIPHYRKDIVSNLLDTKYFTSYFITSKKYLTNTSVSFENKRVLDGLIFRSFKVFNHTFYWLQGVTKYLKEINPNIIVFTGYDPHMIHIQFLFFKYVFFSKTKILWWSQGNTGKQGLLGKIIRSFFYKNATGILAYSKQSKKNLIQMGVKKNVIKVVNNSIPRDDYAFLHLSVLEKRKEQKTISKIRLISVGKLTYLKRLDLLVDAVAELKQKNIDVICNIIGLGAEEQNLKVKIKQLNLQNEIIMHGAKYGSDLNQLFFESDIYVLPGAVGLSILHAFSYGLPMITSDDFTLHCPEIELLSKGENGDFYSGLNPDMLADKILQWHEKLKTDREMVAEACINSIYQHGYLPDQMISNIVSHIKKIST